MIKLPISLVIITLNEEKNIQRCIASVPFASEVIVVDSFSKDKTTQIAEKMGASVYQEEWKGYGEQKKSAVAKASYDWILSLDADEALSPALCEEIQSLFMNSSDHSQSDNQSKYPTKMDDTIGYKIPRRSYYLGRWIDHGGWYPDYQLRLFNRKYSNWDAQKLHEKVVAPMEVKLENPMYHWVFRDISHQVVTNDKYSSLGAEHLMNSGKKYTRLGVVLRMLFKPATKFVETYYAKLGFLDGIPGFIISISAAYSVFLKWAKIWEMKIKKK